MRLYTARREPKALPEVGEVPPSEQDPELKGFDFLLRSILSQQGMHSTDIRKAVRGLESMTAKLNSVEEMLRRVDLGVQRLGTQEETS